MSKNSGIVVEDEYANEFVSNVVDGELMVLSPEVASLPEEEIQSLMANSFAEMVQNDPLHNSTLTVVLDCANIGWSYGRNHFSVHGVVDCIEYFSKRNVRVVGFIPLSYIRRKAYHDEVKSSSINTPARVTNALMDTDELLILEKLCNDNIIAPVPAGDLDDEYVLTYARENNYFVISNDLFMDHMRKIQNDSVRRSLSIWLRSNRCSYTFVRGKFMINPNSPLMECIMSKTEGEMDVDIVSKQEISAPECDSVLSMLNNIISTLAVESNSYSQELKHLYLARSQHLLKLGLVNEASDDVLRSMNVDIAVMDELVYLRKIVGAGKQK